MNSFHRQQLEPCPTLCIVQVSRSLFWYFNCPTGRNSGLLIMIGSKCGAFPNKLPEKNCVTLKPDIALWSGTFTSAESAALQDFSKSQPAVDLLPLSQSTTFNKSLEVLRKARDFHVCCHCCKLEALQLLVRWRFEIRRSHRHRIRYINNKKRDDDQGGLTAHSCFIFNTATTCLLTKLNHLCKRVQQIIKSLI